MPDRGALRTRPIETPVESAVIRQLAASLPSAPQPGVCHCGTPVKGYGLEMCHAHSDETWNYFLTAHDDPEETIA